MLIQLHTPIPVTVVPGSGWLGPTGKGMAIGWWQPSIDYHLIWFVFFDETGQMWQVENPNIRARANFTWGRPTPEGADSRFSRTETNEHGGSK